MKSEKGKVTLNNVSEITVSLSKTYIKPVIKITPSEDINVYLSEVSNSYFKISSSSEVSSDIYYVVIEGN